MMRINHKTKSCECIIIHLDELYIASNTLLGPDHSHATGQSQGQSQKTQSHDQTNDPKPANERMTTMTKQSTNMPNVHTVMTPMSQPVGGWHVTSMTRQPGTIMSMHELHDQTDKTIG